MTGPEQQQPSRFLSIPPALPRHSACSLRNTVGSGHRAVQKWGIGKQALIFWWTGGFWFGEHALARRSPVAGRRRHGVGVLR